MFYRVVAGTQQYRAAGGGVYDWSNALLGLPCPHLRNRRARFWFTKMGWKRFGQSLIRGLKEEGFTVVIKTCRSPTHSAIVYEDNWQVAILPDKEEYAAGSKNRPE